MSDVENPDVGIPTTLEARIRELEAENQLWRDGERAELREVQSFQARIRELERRLKEFTPEDIRGMAYDTNAMLQKRIAKAREILKHHHVHAGEICPICRALAALEGK